MIGEHRLRRLADVLEAEPVARAVAAAVIAHAPEDALPTEAEVLQALAADVAALREAADTIALLHGALCAVGDRVAAEVAEVIARPEATLPS